MSYVDMDKVKKITSLEKYLEFLELLKYDQLEKEELVQLTNRLEELSKTEVEGTSPKIGKLVAKLVFNAVAIGTGFATNYFGLPIVSTFALMGASLCLGAVVPHVISIAVNAKKQKFDYDANQSRSRKLLTLLKSKITDLSLENSEELNNSEEKAFNITEEISLVENAVLVGELNDIYNKILLIPETNRKQLEIRLYQALASYKKLQRLCNTMESQDNVIDFDYTSFGNENFRKEINNLALDTEAAIILYGNKGFEENFNDTIKSFISDIVNSTDALGDYVKLSLLGNSLIAMGSDKALVLNGMARCFWITMKYVGVDLRNALIESVPEEYIGDIIGYAEQIMAILSDTPENKELKAKAMAAKQTANSGREYVEVLTYTLDKLNVFNREGFHAKRERRNN